MQPYYTPGDQPPQFSAANVYRYGYARPPVQASANFMPPNTFTQSRGFYRPNFSSVRLPSAMGTYNAGNQISRGSQPATVENNRQQKDVMAKMVKDRNYQMQQQRLREFNPSQGSKLKADKLIENVMGKLGTDPMAAGTNIKVENKISRNSTSLITSNSHFSAANSKSGQKARDWSTIGDLEQVFASSTNETSSELPLWCREGSTAVPAAYLEVENCVTRYGKIDTNLVYPVLLSSGLSREVLGRVWALANRETPGILTSSELYAILAMIGLVQNACEVYSISILNTVAQPPIPLLNVVNNLAAPQISNVAISQQDLQPVISNVDDFDDFQSASTTENDSVTPVPNKTIFSSSVGSRLANYDLTRPKDAAMSEHEEPSKQELIDDLMEPVEDKYNIFRLIEPMQSANDDFGSFVCSAKESISDVQPFEERASKLNLNDFDDFQWSGPLPPAPIVSINTGDASAVHDVNIVEFVPDEDDDFGDFAAAEANVTGSTTGISMMDILGPSPLHSEVQSVASLDLGIVDTRSETPPVIELPEFGIKSDTYSVDTIAPADRYSFLKRDSERSSIQENCHSYEWRRCLESCHQLIKNTLLVFNGGSSSAVCHEVINCDEGENYIKSIVEIYRVSLRISHWVQLVQSEERKLLQTTVSSIENEWNRLLPFIIASPVVPSEGKSRTSKRAQPDQTVIKPCGVCLMDVERCDDDDCAPHLNLAQLTYGGRMYHATCANFWVNCIDSKLPSLPLLS